MSIKEKIYAVCVENKLLKKISQLESGEQVSLF